MNGPCTWQQRGISQRLFGFQTKTRIDVDSPLALTQLAFKLGRAAWSLSCSRGSGGSWYT